MTLGFVEVLGHCVAAGVYLIPLYILVVTSANLYSPQPKEKWW